MKIKTRKLPLIFRVSTPGIATMQTALMHMRLKAAEPTIVPGPNAPDSKLLPTISVNYNSVNSIKSDIQIFEIKI
jgi:hypothetical protein